MPKFERLRPLLICRDVSKLVHFYTEILEFSIVDRMDDVGLSGWAALSRDNTALMLASPSYISAPDKDDFPLNQVILYIEVSNVSQLRQDILAKNYPVGILENRFYRMQEFELTDPEGHRIICAEELE